MLLYAFGRILATRDPKFIKNFRLRMTTILTQRYPLANLGDFLILRISE
jgi:hypothetical protein